MTKHLREVHPEAYNEYLTAKGAETKKKVEEVKANKKLEEELEQDQEELDELQGSSSQVRKRPLTTAITKYFSKSGSGPAKYKLDSDLQRRAELDIAIYMVTGNLAFNHVESKAFRRFMQARDPKVTVRSRSALVKTTIPLLERNLNEAKDRLLAQNMTDLPGAAFTTDIWSSRGKNRS
jgi:hypothetical protein